MKVNDDLITKVAERARIKLAAEKIPILKRQVEIILEYFTQVEKIPTNKQDLRYDIKESTLEREDNTLSFNSENILKEAPKREGSSFKVPLIIDGKVEK